jgi:hypothetical protein
MNIPHSSQVAVFVRRESLTDQVYTNDQVIEKLSQVESTHNLLLSYLAYPLVFPLLYCLTSLILLSHLFSCLTSLFLLMFSLVSHLFFSCFMVSHLFSCHTSLCLLSLIFLTNCPFLRPERRYTSQKNGSYLRAKVISWIDFLKSGCYSNVLVRSIMFKP